MLVIEHLDFEGRKLDVALKLVLLDVFDVRHPPWVDIFRQTPPREYDVRLKLCQCNEFRAQLQSFYTILPPWPPTQSSAAQAADGNFSEYGIDTKHGSLSRTLIISAQRSLMLASPPPCPLALFSPCLRRPV